MASDYSAARQEFVDRINAGVSLTIPFMQKRVNLGKDAINKNTRSNGVIEVYVPAGGTGDTEQLTGPNGPIANALDRTNDTQRGNSSYYKVSCYAHNGWELVNHGALEDIFQIGEITPNIVRPRINHLVQNIEKDLVGRNWTRAAGACVSATADFGVLSKSMAYLEAIKSTGSWTGFMSPLLKSLLSTASMREKFDLPDDIMKEMYRRNSIGIYANADWVNEAFMPMFKQGAALSTANTGVKVAAAVSTQGADQIQLTGLSTGPIKKGTTFTIEGVYDVSTAGLQMDWLKVFVVQEDATDTEGAATVKVLPIYFNDNTKGYQNTVFVDGSAIAAQSAVTGLCDSGATYYTALIKEDEAFNWTPFELPDVEGCNNTTTTTEEMSVQLASGGNLLKRYNSMRLDCAYFGDIVDPRACRLIYVKA